MSDEPTKEQIEEVIRLESFLSPLGWDSELNYSDIACVIAHVRTQATNDALERAAVVCKSMGDEQDMANVNECADEIRELMARP